MTKKCEICEAPVSNPRFSLCKDCNDSKRLPQLLRIVDSFYKDKHLKREVYLDIPERLAKLFHQGDLGMNKLRSFFCMVRNAYEAFSLSKDKCFDNVKPQLWKIITAVEDRTRRKITPPSFLDFMKSGIAIAEKDETGKELYGFVELFRSIIAYSR